MVVRLNAVGEFGWDDWVKEFSAEIQRSPEMDGESSTQAYYRQWVFALERILISRGIIDDGDTDARAIMWRDAYLHTPHGQPVDLGNAGCPPAHHHRAVPRGVPIAVSSPVS